MTEQNFDETLCKKIKSILTEETDDQCKWKAVLQLLIAAKEVKISWTAVVEILSLIQQNDIKLKFLEGIICNISFEPNIAIQHLTQVLNKFNDEQTRFVAFTVIDAFMHVQYEHHIWKPETATSIMVHFPKHWLQAMDTISNHMLYKECKNFRYRIKYHYMDRQ